MHHASGSALSYVAPFLLAHISYAIAGCALLVRDYAATHGCGAKAEPPAWKRWATHADCAVGGGMPMPPGGMPMPPEPKMESIANALGCMFAPETCPKGKDTKETDR